MPKGKANPKINAALLNTKILGTGLSRRAFAKTYGFNNWDIQKWCLGTGSPSLNQLKRLAAILETDPQLFYIPGEEYLQMSVQAALTRWANQHVEEEREALNDAVATQLIKAREPEALEETKTESKEAPIQVSGEVKLSVSTE